MLSNSKRAEVCFTFKYKDIYCSLIVIHKELHIYWHNYMRLINSDELRKKTYFQASCEKYTFSAAFTVKGDYTDILVHASKFRVF